MMGETRRPVKGTNRESGMVEYAFGRRPPEGGNVRWMVSFVGAAVLATQAVAAGSAPVFAVTASWDGTAPQPGANATVVLRVTVAPGWHVNSNVPLDEFLIPTSVRLECPPGWRAEPPIFPPHSVVRLAFSEGPVAVFTNTFEIRVPVRAGTAPPAISELRGAVEAQACNDKLCLAPTEVPFSLAVAGQHPVPARLAPTADSQGAARRSETAAPAPGTFAERLWAHFLRAGILLQLLLTMLGGLLLNLTPCVYPLIPITIGFFLSQKEESSVKPWVLAAFYALGIVITYTALGATAALAGKLFGSALQSPWVVGTIVAVLLALAASMFGLWEFRVPAFVNNLSGGRRGPVGAWIMGLVVGLVAAPCVGPFVSGLLVYVGEKQDVGLGVALFFGLGLGLALPYLLLGIFTDSVDRLPNSGAWMLSVKQFFGVLLIAMAGYFARPLLAPPRGDWLLAGLLGAGGLYLLLVARPGHEHPWIDRLMRAASAAVLVAGVLLAPRSGSRETPAVVWQEYDGQVVSAAIAAGNAVVLDFHATWCLPCKELDEKTFSDPEVAARLVAFARFKVDLTTSDPRTEAIRQRFGVAGVPTIEFFVAGKEVDSARLTGFEPPKQFLARLDSVIKAR